MTDNNQQEVVAPGGPTDKKPILAPTFHSLKGNRIALLMVVFLSLVGLATALVGVKMVQETRRQAAVGEDLCRNQGVTEDHRRSDGKVWIKNGETVTLKYYYSDNPVSCPYGPNSVSGLEPSRVWENITVPDRASSEAAGGAFYQLRPGKCGQVDVFWSDKPGTQCGDCNPSAGCSCQCIKTKIYRNPDCTGEMTDLSQLEPGHQVYLGIKGKKGEDASLIEKARFRVLANGQEIEGWRELINKNERRYFCTQWTVPEIQGRYRIEGEVYQEDCNWQ